MKAAKRTPNAVRLARKVLEMEERVGAGGGDVELPAKWWDELVALARKVLA